VLPPPPPPPEYPPPLLPELQRPEPLLRLLLLDTAFFAFSTACSVAYE
jgi:hypothetical protein